MLMCFKNRFTHVQLFSNIYTVYCLCNVIKLYNIKGYFISMSVLLPLII